MLDRDPPAPGPAAPGWGAAHHAHSWPTATGLSTTSLLSPRVRARHWTEWGFVFPQSGNQCRWTVRQRGRVQSWPLASKGEIKDVGTAQIWLFNRVERCSMISSKHLIVAVVLQAPNNGAKVLLTNKESNCERYVRKRFMLFTRSYYCKPRKCIMDISSLYRLKVFFRNSWMMFPQSATHRCSGMLRACLRYQKLITALQGNV